MTGPAAEIVRVLVLGVGNELRSDDGVGSMVARRLQAEALGPSVKVVDGAADGLSLIFEMHDYERVIIVDAAHMGLEPGAVRVVEREQLEDSIQPLASLHNLSLHDTLELAELAGVVAEVQIVAVEPETILPGLQLSAPVQAAVPEAIRAVKELLAATSSEPG